MKWATRPISTDADYRAALALAEELFDAEPGTPEGGHLDALITLIEAYEDQHYPMDLCDACNLGPRRGEAPPGDASIDAASQPEAGSLLISE